ncbi:MAG: hypothetical protein ACM3MK_12680 [Chitinophagales bacterium]
MDGIGSINSSLQDAISVATLKKSMEQAALPLQVIDKTLEALNQNQPQKSAPPSSALGGKIDIFA